MGNFDEFCKKHELKFNLDYVELAWIDGAQSRQAEIDELNKRIDGVLDYVFGLYSTCDLDTKKLENILKGNQS